MLENSKGANGVVQIDGDKWREQRRFALHTLRDFGVGRPLMEQKIMLEVEALVDFLGKESRNGQEKVELNAPIANCVGNIINNMLFSCRFKQGDLKMTKLHHLLDRQSQIVMKSIMGAYITCPWTTKIPVLNSKWLELMDIKRQLCAFLAEQIAEHREKWDIIREEQAEVEDLTYAYMKEVERRMRSGEDVGFFDDLQLQMLLLDLFFAGMETTVTTLKWAFLLVAKNPSIQKRVQEELDQLGEISQISLAEKTRLPLTQATINEIQRIANILPFNLLRTVGISTKIDGFSFEKGDLIIPQVSILMNDPEIFDEPHIFNPDRFLDENYNVKKIEEFLPFSIGRRQCLGESLAKAELFLVFANLLKNFEIRVEDTVSMERVLGLTVSPPVYKCELRRRIL
ncbi:unnamed protein product [Caenorhabditis angaria]|uniref:Cytochrome P450 n=1 Tax=Caenorhabditis angaria TaxID=860376 RepID=A0A9P1IEK1_9PELO|nr:unnamed protein product [Caenorhabditis angaria]